MKKLQIDKRVADNNEDKWFIINYEISDICMELYID